LGNQDLIFAVYQYQGFNLLDEPVEDDGAMRERYRNRPSVSLAPINGQTYGSVRPTAEFPCSAEVVASRRLIEIVAPRFSG
jgi:hypothetical protein